MSEMNEEYDILIIGGGPIGLALAAGLMKTSCSLAVVDAAPVPEPAPETIHGVEGFDARVSALTSASIGFLRRLEAWDETLAGRACPFTDMQVWDGEGTASIHFSAADLLAASFGSIAENRQLVAALANRLRQGPAQVIRPAKVVSLDVATEPAPYRHRVVLDNGRVLFSRLLVGADGGNSIVRRGAGFSTREWSYGQKAIVATVKTTASHQFTAWQRFTGSGPLAFLPLLNPATAHPQQQYFSSIVWSCDTSRAEELMALNDTAFVEELGSAFEYRLGPVQAVSPRKSFPLWQIHARNYIGEGVALVGDAAHSLHPLAGQGVNLGLKDVEVLAEELHKAWRTGEDWASERILSRYQRRRKGDNLGMMLVMEGFKRLFEQDDLFWRWLRNQGVAKVDRLAPVKHLIMRKAMGF